MRHRNNHLTLIWFAILTTVLLFLIEPNNVFARAGGGGRGGGGGIAGLIMLPFIIVYYAILSFLVAKKYRNSKALLEKLVRKDKIWNLRDIKHRIEMAFFTVQEAWRERDQTIAQDYMSDELFAKHKMQTDQMIRQGRINVLEKVNLIKSAIVQVADYRDDSKDCLWVFIKGSMIDYMMDEKTKNVIEGNPQKVEKFIELWKFIRHPQKGWVLDEIEQEAKISEIADLKSFSEDLAVSQEKELIDNVGRAAGKIEWLTRKDSEELPEMKSPFFALFIGLIAPWILVGFVLFSYFYKLY